ncbi:MAG: DUF5723 family protein [Prevotellaceae bacterium]|jgi:hypothetical protein|nr:DUF5723 family protein [Prevotellaceae bacterium]
MKKHLILLSVLLLTWAVQVAAQESTLLHFMRNSPQSLRSNPANLLDTVTSFVGIPFLSNINADFNLGFAYADAIYRNPGNDSLSVNRDIVDKLTRSTRLGLDAHYELMSFGVRFREDNMVTFSLSAKAFGTFHFPKDLAVLLVHGNTPGETLSFDSDINASACVEVAVGYARTFNENWKMGVKVKYLAGLANIYGDDLTAAIATHPDDFSLQLSSQALVRTASVKDNPFENSGLGFDAGLYYKSPVKGLEFSLSLIDWGYIQWNSVDKVYQSKVRDGRYEFKGITDIKDNNLNAILDTLESVMKFNDVDNPDPYTSPLPGKIYFGASCDLNPFDKLGFLFSTRALQKFSRTTFAFMYSRSVGKWLTVAAGNNFMLQKFFNPSVAAHFRLGNFQLHLTGENLSSFNVKAITTANIQFGMNITIY